MSTLDGQLAVVTGATGAIGRAIAARLLASGAAVCAVGSNRESLDELIRATGWSDGRVHGFSVDLTIEEQVRQFCADCSARFDSIDVLVHCAGTIELGSVQEARLLDFDRQYQVNVRAPFQITQALISRLAASRGQVVFVNSTAGLRASAGAAQYGATKHALRALADGFREEVNRDGIRVLSIFLGRTASRMQSLVHRHEGRPYDGGKLLQPDDVASMVVHSLELPRSAEVTDIWIRPLLKSY